MNKCQFAPKNKGITNAVNDNEAENMLKVYLIIMEDNHYLLLIHAMPERSDQEHFRWICFSSDNQEYPIHTKVEIDGVEQVVPDTFESAVLPEEFICSHKLNKVSCIYANKTKSFSVGESLPETIRLLSANDMVELVITVAPEGELAYDYILSKKINK